MFAFFVKYFGFLKAVPFAAHLFDTQLRLLELLTFSPVLKFIDDIEVEVLSWPGVYKSMHKYGGLQFNFGGRELGHIHSNGLLDMRFSRKVKAQLLANGRAADHHTFKKSGWISFYLRTNDDALYARELFRIAFLQISGRVSSQKRL